MLSRLTPLLLLLATACAPSESIYYRIEAGPQATEIIRDNLYASETLLGFHFIETDRDWGTLIVRYREPDPIYSGIAHIPTAAPEDWCNRRVGVILDPIVTAHEVGHAFGLPHHMSDYTNVMYPTFVSQTFDDLWISDDQYLTMYDNLQQFNQNCARL